MDHSFISGRVLIPVISQRESNKFLTCPEIYRVSHLKLLKIHLLQMWKIFEIKIVFVLRMSRNVVVNFSLVCFESYKAKWMFYWYLAIFGTLLGNWRIIYCESFIENLLFTKKVWFNDRYNYFWLLFAQNWIYPRKISINYI